MSPAVVRERATNADYFAAVAMWLCTLDTLNAAVVEVSVLDVFCLLGRPTIAFQGAAHEILGW
jgi:hypothetical protein